MKKIRTEKYNSYLDDLCKNEDKEVFIKAKLIGRRTYGEYVGEPKNGFALEIKKGNLIVLNLDNVDIYVDEGESE